MEGLDVFFLAKALYEIALMIIEDIEKREKNREGKWAHSYNLK